MGVGLGVWISVGVVPVGVSDGVGVTVGLGVSVGDGVGVTSPVMCAGIMKDGDSPEPLPLSSNVLMAAYLYAGFTGVSGVPTTPWFGGPERSKAASTGRCPFSWRTHRIFLTQTAA